MPDQIVCQVCPRHCRLEEAQTGYCGVRINLGGENRDGLYRRLLPTNPPVIGPAIESDQPVAEYLAWFPGCNLKCRFCAFPGLSAAPKLREYDLISEDQIVEEASTWNSDRLCFFGGEPSIHYEYVLEASKLCRDRGIKTVLTTNGYVSEWLAEKLAAIIDIPFIGIKGSASAALYREMSADPMDVLTAAEIFLRKNKQTQITDLVGPGLKFTAEDENRLADWIQRRLSPEVMVRLEYLRKPLPVFDRLNGMTFPSASNLNEERAILYGVADRLTRRGLRNVWLMDMDTGRTVHVSKVNRQL